MDRRRLSYEPGYIERRYKPCDDDQSGGTNTTKVGDLCYAGSNAMLSLGGKSTELVYDSTHGWHAADDSGEKIQKLTNSTEVTGNGDNDGEHWKVTTTDGTQYYFGLNRLPGWKDSTTAGDQLDPDRAGVRQPVRRAVLQRLLRQRVVPAGVAVEPGLRRRRARQCDGVLLEQGDQQLRP